MYAAAYKPRLQHSLRISRSHDGLAVHVPVQQQVCLGDIKALQVCMPHATGNDTVQLLKPASGTLPVAPAQWPDCKPCQAWQQQKLVDC